MAPCEVLLIAEAKKYQNEEEMQKLAWVVAHIISYTGRLKRPIKPSKLLPQKENKRVKHIENKEEEWQELKRLFGEVSKWPKPET